MASELDQDEVASVPAVAGDEAFSGRLGVARLHPVKAGGAQEEPVGRVEDAEASVGITETVRPQGHGFPEVGIPVCPEGNARHVPRGGVLRGGKPVGIDEMGAGGAAPGGQAVHLPGKQAEASGMTAGKRRGAVVGAVDQHGPQQFPPWIGVSGADPDLGGLHGGILAGDPDRCIQGVLLCNDHRGHELLGAGYLPRDVRVLLVEGAARACIDQDRRGGQDFRGVGGPERGGGLWCHLHHGA